MIKTNISFKEAQKFFKELRKQVNEWEREFAKLKISLCPHCYYMTYTTPKGRCGKCKRKK